MMQQTLQAVPWPAEDIWQAVVPLVPGFTVEIVPEIDSTNTELMRRARAGQTDPVLLVAERQRAGRGRLGRDWQSDVSAAGTGQMPDSLTFSLGLVLQPQDWSGLSLAVGLAVAGSLDPALQIKWPNDIWLQERKLAGILVETASVGQSRYVVVGVGINVQPRSDAGLRTPAAALSSIWPQARAPQALQRLIVPLVQTLLQFEQTGFAPFQNDYRQRDALLGREVICTDGTTGLAQGVNAQGALMVHTERAVVAISSAEVSVRPAGGACAVTLPS